MRYITLSNKSRDPLLIITHPNSLSTVTVRDSRHMSVRVSSHTKHNGSSTLSTCRTLHVEHSTCGKQRVE